MTTLIVILISLLIMLYLFYKIGTAISEEMGKIEAENERLKKDKDLADKRAAEMLKERTRGEVVDDLRNNRF